jgi:hypothetical protein
LIDCRAGEIQPYGKFTLRSIMANYIFTTPIVEEGPSGAARLFTFYRLKRGISVAKRNGVYVTERYSVQSDVNSAEEYYLGGSNHIVNDTTKAALIAGNIGVTESNFTLA